MPDPKLLYVRGKLREAVASLAVSRHGLRARIEAACKQLDDLATEDFLGHQDLKSEFAQIVQKLSGTAPHAGKPFTKLRHMTEDELEETARMIFDLYKDITRVSETGHD